MNQHRGMINPLTAAYLAVVLVLLLTAPFPAYGECYDVRGEIVIELPDERINDVARASLEGAQVAVIRYNPKVLSWFAPQTRQWFYAHECAHHVRGHNFGPYTVNFQRIAEVDADCFATETLIRSGSFDSSDLAVVKSDLARLGPGDWVHLPGGQRAINIERCAEEKPIGEIEIFVRPLPPGGVGTAVVADIRIDGEDVGTVRNGSVSDSRITADDLTEGTHAYYLRVNAMEPLPPFRSEIMERVGTIRIEDGARYQVTGNMDSGELKLIKQ